MNLRPVLRRFSLRCLALIVLVAIPSRAATNVVTTLADSGVGSLRQVISNSVSGDTIIFATNGTVALTNGELLITKNLNIIGPGAGNLAISGSGTMRVFNVSAGVTSSVSSVTIRDGRCPLASGNGGAILNAGIMSISDAALVANSARAETNRSAYGGSIYNSGTLSIRRCVFEGNSAASGAAQDPSYFPAPPGSAYGGAIFSATGFVQVADSSFNGNSAQGSPGMLPGPGPLGPAAGYGGGANGGAIGMTRGTFIASNTVFTGNSTLGGQGNGGGSASGGAIWSTLASNYLDRCDISNNRATGAGDSGGAAGGGLYVSYAELQNCSIVGNSCTGEDGPEGYGNTGGRSGGGASAGGAYIAKGFFVRVTVALNSLNGGNGGDYHQNVTGQSGSAGYGGITEGGGMITGAAGTNSTISQNVCYSGKNGDWYPALGFPTYGSLNSAYGGGLSGSSNYCGLTIVNNTAVGGHNPSYAIYNYGGGFYGQRTATAKSCIFYGNNASSGPDASLFTSQGFNLFGTSAGTSNLLSSDVRNLDARLGALANNGGPTLTHALLSGSPAIDAGDDTLTGKDQRGCPRRSGAHVDIGAFEFTAPTFAGLRKLTNGAVAFTTVSDTPFNVVANPNVAAPSNQWINLGPATAIGPGVYEFTDTTATNNPYRFFRLRWP